MEAARSFWTLEDVMATIVERVTAEGKTVSEIIDQMWPVRLLPADADLVLRTGLVSLANDRAGMRSVRSGKVQSVTTRLHSVPEASTGMLEWATRTLARLIFEAADGSMRSVLEFTHEDAKRAYDRRVRAVREQANREAPFWKELVATTSNGQTLGAHGKQAQSRLAKLAIEAQLTNDIE